MGLANPPKAAVPRMWYGAQFLPSKGFFIGLDKVKGLVENIKKTPVLYPAREPGVVFR